MAAPNAFHGQCKCCLKTTYLKNMWEPQENNGQWEVYGQMLVDCFGIDWTILNVEDDNICQVCISKLRVATNFKRQVMDNQATTLQEVDEVAAIEKVECANRVQVETIPTLDCKEVEVSFVQTLQKNLKHSLTNVAVNKTSSKQVLIKKENSTPVTKENFATNVQPKNNNQIISQNANIIKTPFKKVKVCISASSASPETALKKENKTVVVRDVIEKNEVNTEPDLELNDEKIKYENEEEEVGTLEYVDEEVLNDTEEDILENMEEETLENMDEEEEIYEYEDQGEETFDNDEEDKPYEDLELSDSISVEYLDEDEDYKPKPKSRKVQEKTSDGRVIKRRSKRKVYTVDALRQAFDAVASGEMSKREAARVFNVPRMKIGEDCVANTTEDVVTSQLVKALRALLTYTNATPFKVTRSDTFKCFYCTNDDGATFQQPDDLRRHTHTEHPDKIQLTEFAVRPRCLNQLVRVDVYKLECCEDVTWEDMRSHLRNKHGVDDIDEAWKIIVPYELHMEKDVMSCVFSDCDFTGCFSKLDTHVHVHFPNYICGNCGKPFAIESSLKRHEKFHQSEFPCHECQQIFTSKKKRKFHEDTVHAKRLIHKCLVCPLRFETDMSKMEHLRSEHEDLLPTRGRHCELCGKYFWPRDFTRHIKFVHDKHTCDVCGRRFDRVARLKAHECQPNKAIKKFKCSVCSRLFLTEGSVFSHMSKAHNAG